jgi:glycerophosphoryl diester phosphodiesterase
MPSFIMHAIESNFILMFLLILVLALLSVVAFRWIFSIHFFVTEKVNFREARKQSTLMNKKRYGRNVFHLLLWNLVVLVVVLLTAIIGIGLIAFVIKVFASSKVAISMTLATTAVVVIFLLTMFSSLTIPITFAFLSAMYYQNKFNRGDDIPLYQPLLRKYPRFNKIAVIVLIASSVINIIYIDIVSDDSFSFRVQFLDKPLVSAHRGDSVTAPENTMKAFESAIESQADYIELDVQQTKDGVIVVMHDSNLKRTTGINKNIWEVTYEEIKELDAGSWFHKDFADARIPTLEEVLDYCKNEIKLNIELKPTGHEVDFEKCVADIVHEYEFEEDCVVASLDYETLKKVKGYAPDLTTVFVMAVAYGELTYLEYADVFSIESYFVTNSIVNDLHEQGVEVYAWTVNTEETIQDMIDVGVDNIITDAPVLARELIYSKSLNENIVDFIYGLLE